MVKTSVSGDEVVGQTCKRTIKATKISKNVAMVAFLLTKLISSMSAINVRFFELFQKRMKSANGALMKIYSKRNIYSTEICFHFVID